MMRTSLPALLLLGLSPWALANASCTPEDLVGATPVRLPASTVISAPKELSIVLPTGQDGSFGAIRARLSSGNRELDRAAAESIRQASLLRHLCLLYHRTRGQSRQRALLFPVAIKARADYNI